MTIVIMKFYQQLMILGKPNDVLIGISASGNSMNLINAFKYAVKNNMETIALTSFDGGAFKWRKFLITLYMCLLRLVNMGLLKTHI